MEFDLLHIWETMNIFVKIISVGMIGMSVFMLYIIGERLVTFSAASGQNIRYVLALRDFLAKNRIEDAHKAAQAHGKSPVAKVMESGLSALKKGREALHSEGPADVGDFDLVDSVNRALERVKERETSGLRKGLAGLGTVATTTPFIGLFGTVIGIITAFQGIAASGGGGIGAVSAGIAEALIVTAVGLFVAIASVLLFNYLTARFEKFDMSMQHAASELVDYLEGAGGVQSR
jgi:biopolymer transport protein ExbB/TolQ